MQSRVKLTNLGEKKHTHQSSNELCFSNFICKTRETHSLGTHKNSNNLSSEALILEVTLTLKGRDLYKWNGKQREGLHRHLHKCAKRSSLMQQFTMIKERTVASADSATFRKKFLCPLIRVGTESRHSHLVCVCVGTCVCA